MKLRPDLVLPLALIITGSSVAQAADLARINGKVISVEEFNKKYQTLLPLYPNKTPTKAEVLDDLIKRELGIQEAKKLGLERDPEVQDEIQTVLYQAYLKRALGKEFDKLSVSDDEAKSWYDKNPEIRTSHIFIQVTPNASAADDKKALDRIREIEAKDLKSGKSFAEVAQAKSEGVAAPMGGDIDYQMKDRLDPKYYSAALALRTPGKVTGVVRTQFGYHIIKLTAIRSWTEVDRNLVKSLYLKEKREELFERAMKSLRSKAQVQINAQHLK